MTGSDHGGRGPWPVRAGRAPAPATMLDLDRFREAKQALGDAESGCRRAWLLARTGEEPARRRYRTALLELERAHDRLRRLGRP